MEESSVKTILTGLRTYLRSNLKCDKSFISSLSAADLLSDNDADILRSSVSQGGDEAQDGLLQYMEWYYDQKTLEKFCVFLDDYSKPAKPRLSEIAVRIRQEMEKLKPGPIHQPTATATPGEPTPTVSTMDERSQKIKRIVDTYRNESTDVSLPEIPELEGDFDSIMGTLNAELSSADPQVICKLVDMVRLKYRRYIHGVKPVELLSILNTADGLYNFIAAKSTPYEILLVHHAIDVLGTEDLKGTLQRYESNLGNHLRQALQSYKKRKVTLPLRMDYTHLAIVLSKEQILLSLVLHIKEYLMKYLQLEETIFEGFGEGCTVLFYSILKGDTILLALKIFSHSAELKRMFDITHLVVFDYFACDLERATIELPNIIHQKDTQLQQKDTQLREQDAELEKQDTLLQQKDAQLKQKDVELQHKDEESGRRYAILLKERSRSLSAEQIPKPGDQPVNVLSLALHAAASSGNISEFETVVQKCRNMPGFDFDCLYEGRTPLHTAAKSGHVDIVGKLIELGCDLSKTNDNGLTAIHYAAGYGHVDVVAKLAELGYNVDKTDNNGLTVLHIAAERGHVDVAAKLIELGCDMNKTDNKGQTALHYAAGYGHVDVVAKLIELNCDMNKIGSDGLTALHYAAGEGHVDVVAKLVELGCDTSKTTNLGFTALHIAADQGRVGVVAKLVELGCDVNERDLLRCAALHHAASTGHVEVVTKLIELGCDMNATASDEATALHLAATMGHADVVAELVRHGMDVNRTTTKGVAPLHIAAQEGHVNVVTKLIELGCDKNKTNARGQTALDIAKAAGHIDIVAKLTC